ncbi:hypothetical protein Z517_01384 [Fonsecaea pedrosoi CBS 271.37]|uniref:NADP-dependent oxidoreductase domain-containing protein n=1 Tax=Fonsecaea pedrosoi CBS 271.37 TaxID=1442368 RepID=A0A0D2H555_9EURO|nr:uncharacterized protein Z517_01384 [Fonsecaea pedrosoi CBS 271.37]KIW85990.1 hypothetical protein Z517_01384 [Fonsecaea pedrosoi CBS 271.37]
MASPAVVLPRSLQESLDKTQVSYAQLGSSGLRVSIPILGTMSFGHKDWQPWVLDDPDEVDAILKGAFDRGLNTWDTANVYSNGLAERMIGHTLRKHKIPRHKVVLLSKCFSPVGEEPDVHVISYPRQISASKDYVNQEGLSRTAIFNAVNGSLERLGTEYLDLLQIHRFDPTVPIEETMKALHDLVQSGKVRYIGASSMWTYQFAQMQHVAETHGWTKFVSMQNHYSLCYREEEREMNRFCHDTGVGLIPWAPLYRGLLARPLGSDKTTREASIKGAFAGLHGGDVEIITRVGEVAETRGWKMSHVALAWIVQKGTVPIVGASSLTRLDEICQVRGKALTEDEIRYLEEPYQPRNIVGHH